MDPSSSQIDNNGNDLPAGGINIHERVWDITHTVNPNIECEDPTDELKALQKEPSKQPDTPYQMAFQTGYPLTPEYGQPDQPDLPSKPDQLGQPDQRDQLDRQWDQPDQLDQANGST